MCGHGEDCEYINSGMRTSCSRGDDTVTMTAGVKYFIFAFAKVSAHPEPTVDLSNAFRILK